MNISHKLLLGLIPGAIEVLPFPGGIRIDFDNEINCKLSYHKLQYIREDNEFDDLIIEPKGFKSKDSDSVEWYIVVTEEDAEKE